MEEKKIGQNINPTAPMLETPVSQPTQESTTPPAIEPSNNPHFAGLRGARKLWMIIAAMLLLLVAVGAAYLISKNQTTQPPPTPEATTTPDPTADWETFENNIYRLKYPEGFEVNKDEGNVVTLLKLGPTQKEQTEFYDGISLNFDPREISGNSKDYVEIRLEESRRLGSDITKEISEIEIGEYKGFTYSARGLGNSKYIFLESKSGLFLVITDSTVDPGNLGFTNVVDKIFSTFKFVDQNSDVKTYISSKLGISFSYKYKYNDGDTINIKEIGNKVYVYPSKIKPEDGQYVEVFDKDQTDSLKTAITKTILKGYSTSDCLVNEIIKNPSGSGVVAPASYKFAQTDVPRSGNEELLDLAQKAEKCPSPYVSFGGLTYFLMDQSHASKFIFLSIGQYAIDAGPNQTWQDTIKFTN
ncbi:hypothetical protein A2125_00560 [Candidatus Woesebacteria bacterium GWB1_43_5]|uniref:Uncharacterized protein n=1 Tax=Candidatus Woesebacteria bacterium GWB1_43_5 TaxID=1802474 RepID=A0A1F7WV91_9BACT|nr:MAG: hypothetical protein A2125_00560 [Candidatus Woesebacteria bacterium GWB1_43_5]